MCVSEFVDNSCGIDQVWTWALDSLFEWCAGRILAITALCCLAIGLIGVVKLLLAFKILMRNELDDEVWDMDQETLEAIFESYIEAFVEELRIKRTATAMRKIPRLLTPQRYLTEDDLNTQDRCVICWEMFAIGEGVPRIKHACLKNNNFTHNACLEKWFTAKAESGKLRCPICRDGIK